MRGVCASEVVVSHALQWTAVLVALTASELYVVTVSDRIGNIAVGLFMSLSAFLLIGSLDRNYNLPAYFKRRIKRTWPLYFVVVGIVFVLMDPNWTTLLYNVTFLAIFFPQHAFLVPFPVASGYVVWNLQIEEWAYLCFPLVALLGSPARLAVAASLIAFSSVLFVLVPGVAYTYLQQGLAYNSVWPWLCCFGFGIIAYEMRRVDWKRWGYLTVPLCAVGVAFVDWPWVLILSGPFVMWVLTYPPAFLRRFTLVAIGECSYAIYLVHMLFLDYLGPLSAPLAFVAGWFVEKAQRGKDMARKLATVRNSPG
jgi:peptidoglycan/LPS O-acetylase OafA/YrhL